MTTLPLPGCCNCCNCCDEPVTKRQKSVLFEGPNLRFPQLGEGTAVFHARGWCRGDARRHDEVWAKAAPGRVSKFPGSASDEAPLKLLEAVNNSAPEVDEGVPVALHLAGGAHDGVCMEFSTAAEVEEVYYTEAVPPPYRAEPGIWYTHAADCPCGATGSEGMAPGDHIYRLKAETVDLRHRWGVKRRAAVGR